MIALLTSLSLDAKVALFVIPVVTLFAGLFVNHVLNAQAYERGRR